MLLGTYGRLRQADKAWAIYCHLLMRRTGQGDQGQQQQQQQQAAAAAAVEGAAGAAQQAGAGAKHPGTQQQQQQEMPQQSPGQPVPAAGWEGRLEQRQRELAAQAARLVSDLRLDEVPFEQYAFGALITALSRVCAAAALCASADTEGTASAASGAPAFAAASPAAQCWLLAASPAAQCWLLLLLPAGCVTCCPVLAAVAAACWLRYLLPSAGCCLLAAGCCLWLSAPLVFIWLSSVAFLWSLTCLLVWPQAEHPPYDLPAHYAERAAAAFADMEGRGVEPNVVLWHNLMDCQVSRCRIWEVVEGAASCSQKYQYSAAHPHASNACTHTLGAPPAPALLPCPPASRPRRGFQTPLLRRTAACGRHRRHPPAGLSASLCLPAGARGSRSGRPRWWRGSCHRWDMRLSD